MQIYEGHKLKFGDFFIAQKTTQRVKGGVYTERYLTVPVWTCWFSPSKGRWNRRRYGNWRLINLKTGRFMKDYWRYIAIHQHPELVRG